MEIRGQSFTHIIKIVLITLVFTIIGGFFLVKGGIFLLRWLGIFS